MKPEQRLECGFAGSCIAAAKLRQPAPLAACDRFQRTARDVGHRSLRL
jgi:hypothetical protein